MTIMADSLIAWRELAEKPIRQDAACGHSIRDDVEFEGLQAEMRKVDSLSPQPVLWPEAVRLGRSILASKSKDLLVTAYVCVALFEQDGYPGLAGGLAYLQGMAERWWDGLFPEAKRMRARVNAVVWLVEKLEAAVGRKAPRGSDTEALSQIAETLRALQTLLTDKLGEDAPSLGQLRRTIEDHVRGTETPARAAEPAAAVKPAASSAVPIAARELATMDDVRKALDDVKTVVRRAAAFVRQQDPTRPWPYRLPRALLWMDVGIPPANSEGRTQIPRPRAGLAERYAHLVGQGNWAELVGEVESQFHESVFWLDSHRLAATALSGLGPPFRDAQRAVTGELLALIHRVPDALALKFVDGTPFADDETRRWVSERQRSSASPTTSANGTERSAGAEGDASGQATERARTLLAEGQVKEAVGLVQRELAGLGSSRERFLLRLDLAKLCGDAGLAKLAQGQLELLDQDVTRFGLDEWEPRLSLDVALTWWQVLTRVLQETKPSPELVRLADATYARICRLNPELAVEFDTKKKSGWFSRT